MESYLHTIACGIWAYLYQMLWRKIIEPRLGIIPAYNI